MASKGPGATRTFRHHVYDYNQGSFVKGASSKQDMAPGDGAYWGVLRHCRYTLCLLYTAPYLEDVECFWAINWEATTMAPRVRWTPLFPEHLYHGASRKRD